MKKASIIGLGAAKCGSSWVSYLLEQHPEIQMPSRKEIAYFNAKNFDGSVNDSHGFDLEYYHNFWETSVDGIWAEFSPQYMFDELAIEKIANYNPEAKLLVVLRNPVKRAFSHYLYDVGFNQLIPKGMNFLKAVKAFPYLLEIGAYAKQLDKIYRNFPKTQVKVILLEEAISAPRAFAEDLFKFLGVDSGFCPDVSAVNESKGIKTGMMGSLVQLPSKIKQGLERNVPVFKKALGPIKSKSWYVKLVHKKTKMLESQSEAISKRQLSEDELSFLIAHYDAENQLLSKQLGRDLKIWESYTI